MNNIRESQRNSAFKKRYGITLDEYMAMFRDQGCVCATCGKTNENGHALSVDHDHKTGKVRGLLCQRCNYALGYIDDSVEIAKKMIEYLENAETYKIPEMKPRQLAEMAMARLMKRGKK